MSRGQSLARKSRSPETCRRPSLRSVPRSLVWRHRGAWVFRSCVLFCLFGLFFAHDRLSQKHPGFNETVLFFPGEWKLAAPTGLFSFELISLKQVFKRKEVKVVKITQTLVLFVCLFFSPTRTRKRTFNLRSELTGQSLAFSVPFHPR